MNDTYYDFEDKLKKGKEGEEYVQNLLQRMLPDLEVKISQDWKTTEQDITIYDNGRKVLSIEVKNEDYDISRTNRFSMEKRTSPNIFIEEFSDAEKKTSGGPHRSSNRGVDVVIHVTRTGQIYAFHPERLLTYLYGRMRKAQVLELPKPYPTRIIPNRTYNTSGLLVPIGELEDAGMILSLDDIVGMAKPQY